MSVGSMTALRSNILPSAVVILTVIVAAVLVGSDPVIGGVVVAALLLGVGVLVFPVFGLFAIIAALVVGQLLRIPAFGAEGAMLPNDILIPALAAGWLLRGLLLRRVGFPSSPLSAPLGTMSVVFLLTLIAGHAKLQFLTDRELLASSFYILRWLEYALLFFIVADVIRNEAAARRLMRWLFAAAALLAILGFIQLRIFPDFRFMVPQGWDPHLGRLLSTWFDPNFLGGFFAFVIALVTGVAVFAAGKERIALWVLNALLFAALVLTFSRSAYAAFFAGVMTLTLLKSRRMFLALLLVLAFVVTSVPRVQERIEGALNLDETARLRLVSWENALAVYRDHPVTGIGYNTYRYVQVIYGFQKDAAEHSAGGSDSSLLTILVTTGPVGLAVYVWILWASLSIAWSSYRQGANQFTRGLGFGAVGALLSVIVHSFFLNSLLFPHMLETIAITLGVLVGLRSRERVAEAA